jgi:mRNA-degrading endonuclease RelE of RelBE toxin-antitoxin system
LRFPFTAEARSKLARSIAQPHSEFSKPSRRMARRGVGDVNTLHGEWAGCFRLRVGDYRVIFRPIADGLEILTVGHRSEIYE